MTPTPTPPPDPLKPAAGGWQPTPLQRAIGIGVVAALGGLAPMLLVPNLTPAQIAAGVCTALALGITAALGMQSAGPRSLP